MTLLEDLLLASRTIYERQHQRLLAEMTREAHAGDSPPQQFRSSQTRWRRRLAEACCEHEHRDQSIREFCDSAIAECDELCRPA